MSNLTVITVNQSTSQSILSDIFTFAIILFCFWLNYQFLGNGLILQIVLGISFFCGVVSRANSKIKKMKPLEALKYLKENYENNGEK